MWRAQWAGASAVALVAAVAAGEGLLWLLPLAVLLVGTPLVPEVRYRHWRWDVHEHEIDIRRGTLRVRRTLVPMPRVQHVETTRGVLEQSLGLASVAVHTAAGAHTIPLLTTRDAAQVRDRIAALARTEAA